MEDSGYHRDVCPKCEEPRFGSIKEHYKQMHQMKCSIKFNGDATTIPCIRDADGLWRCPRCNMEFQGSCKKLQVCEHA